MGARSLRASRPPFNELNTAWIHLWAVCTPDRDAAFFGLRAKAGAEQRSGQAFLREPDRASGGGERAGAVGGPPGRSEERGAAHARGDPARQGSPLCRGEGSRQCQRCAVQGGGGARRGRGGSARRVLKGAAEGEHGERGPAG